MAKDLRRETAVHLKDSLTVGHTRMSLATARRRILWNAGGLGVFWFTKRLPVGLDDLYFELLDRMMHIDGVPSGMDEFVDSVFLWLRCALSIVFVCNLLEALITYFLCVHRRQTVPTTGTASIPATEVGKALARRVSQASIRGIDSSEPEKAALSAARASVTATPSTTSASTFQMSPVTPVPGASVLRRSVSPVARSSPDAVRTSSPFRMSTMGLGRPTSTPFLNRSVTPSRPRLPSSPYTPRTAGRPSLSPNASITRHWSPTSVRSEHGTFTRCWLTWQTMHERLNVPYKD